MTITQTQFAVLGGIIFAIGAAGLCLRRDTLGLAMSLLILLLGPVIEFFGFAHTGWGGATPPQGDVVALAVMVALLAFVICALGLALVLWRRAESSDTDQYRGLRG